MTTICVWADGSDRAVNDIDGLRQDVAAALGAPIGDVEVQQVTTDDVQATLTLTVRAPITSNHVATGSAPW